jgi:hypothetical protein
MNWIVSEDNPEVRIWSGTDYSVKAVGYGPYRVTLYTDNDEFSGTYDNLDDAVKELLEMAEYTNKYNEWCGQFK